MRPPMQLRLVTLSFDPHTASFPPDPLAAIGGEIVSVVEHFFEHAGVPRLLLVVHFRPPTSTGRSRAVQVSQPTDGLRQDEQALFEKLRVWRNGRAQAEGVPPYVLVTNRQLAAIARTRPGTLAALQLVEGIGEAKGVRFGAEIIAVVAAAFPVIEGSSDAD